MTHSALRLVLGCALALAAPAQGRIAIAPPAEDHFLVDLAELIDAEREAEAREIARPLLAEHRTPILVVTIELMAEHGHDDVGTMARALFDQWRIGHAELNGAAWNTGILILVSKLDRKAHIALGAGWGHEQDGTCRLIMDEYLLPDFREGNYGYGVVACIKALDAMARGKPLPPPRGRATRSPAPSGSSVPAGVPRSSAPRSHVPGWSVGCAGLPWGILLVVGVVLLVVLARSRGIGGGGGSRRGGGGWGGWGGGGLGGGLGRRHRPRRRGGFGWSTGGWGGWTGGGSSGGSSGGWSGGGSSGGGSSGGGWSGGGRSGGGGASGSW